MIRGAVRHDIELIVDCRRALSLPEDQAKVLRLSSPGFPLQLDDSSAPALRNRLKAVRKASNVVQFRMNGVAFNIRPAKMNDDRKPSLHIGLGDGSYLELNPDECETLSDLIAASGKGDPSSSSMTCTVFSGPLEEERKRQEDESRARNRSRHKSEDYPILPTSRGI